MEKNKKKSRRGSGKKSTKTIPELVQINQETDDILTTNLILLEESYSDSSESEEISNDEFVLKKFPKENEMNLSQPSTSKNLISCESNSTDTNSEEEIIPTRRCRNRKCSLEKSSSSLEDSLVVKETELLERDGVYTFVKTLIKNLDENVIIPDSGEKKKREKKSVKKLQKQLNKLIIGEILPDSTKETTTNDNTTTILKNKQSNKIKKERNESNDCIKNFPSIIYSRNNSLDETEQQASTSSSPIVEKKTPKKSKKGKNSISVPSHNVSSKNNTPLKFSSYWKEAEIEKGFRMDLITKGNLRINQNFYQHAYVSHSDKSMDILIEGIQKRNRALEGDEVIVLIEPPGDWKTLDNGTIQRTGTVVAITQHINNRLAIGFLKLMNDQNKSRALFSPRDSRVPRIQIPTKYCPPHFFEKPDIYKNKLFLAKITKWEDSRYANGIIIQCVGDCDSLYSENLSILLENGIEINPPVDDSLADIENDSIIQKELKKRMDLRYKCIFTIDPATAKDLDDAVSCWKEDDGNYMIGVHISDVAYYLKEGTELDKKVARTATSTYLVDKVYHMLPDEMCALCSLIPNEEKLAFSVIFKITPEGNVIDHEFCRSIIRSCTQLSYEHVQKILDNEDSSEEQLKNNFPPISGNFTFEDIKKTVLILNNLAKVLRGRRFEKGSININQPKAIFKIDHVTKEPQEFSIFERKDSHILIEEFMLLANITVAEHILNTFPKIAVLRCHPPPHKLRLEEVKTQLRPHGVILDISSSKSLNDSLSVYEGDDHIARSRMMVLFHLISKTMERAKYFCANALAPDDYHHYGLCMPVYTHFTSPIRRYPDILVHRLLAASLGYTERPNWTEDNLITITNKCNIQKLNAKRAGEQSVDLYLTNYICKHAPMIEEVVVVEVRSKYLMVRICSMGLTLKLYYDKEDAKFNLKTIEGVPSVEIIWPERGELSPRTMLVTAFSFLKVRIEKMPDVNKLQTTIMRL